MQESCTVCLCSRPYRDLLRADACMELRMLGEWGHSDAHMGMRAPRLPSSFKGHAATCRHPDLPACAFQCVWPAEQPSSSRHSFATLTCGRGTLAGLVLQHTPASDFSPIIHMHLEKPPPIEHAAKLLLQRIADHMLQVGRSARWWPPVSRGRPGAARTPVFGGWPGTARPSVRVSGGSWLA